MMNGRINRWMDVYLDGWMDKIDGQMDAWMDKIDAWMDECRSFTVYQHVAAM